VTLEAAAAIAAPLPERAGASRRALAAWCAFDWANSAFPAIVTTFLFSAYFTRAVAPDAAHRTALWGQMTSLSALVIAIASPILGAIADQGGRRKPWLIALTGTCILATAALWHVRPDADFVTYALVMSAVATVGFELGTVFYNAMLPDLAPAGMIGRLSGWGWGCGYAGGLACLALALGVLVQPEVPPFGLDKSQAEPVRAVVILAAGWMALFALPLLFLTPDRRRSGLPTRVAVARGLKTLWHTLLSLPRHRNLAWFLLANMVFTDGLTTLFTFGGIYAAGSFDMALREVLMFGILLNIAAGIGAAGFAWVDDWIGAKPTIAIALVALSGLGIAILLIHDKTLFYVLACGIGVFLGPAQAASRSLMARLAPPALRAEMFGLFALTGRATAFLGPAVLGWVTYATGSQRWGMATIPVFLLTGLLLLLRVREPRE
jgi:UMF1 family MFS transporter